MIIHQRPLHAWHGHLCYSVHNSQHDGLWEGSAWYKNDTKELSVGPLLMANGRLSFETLCWLLGRFQSQEIQPHFQVTCFPLSRIIRSSPEKAACVKPSCPSPWSGQARELSPSCVWGRRSPICKAGS